MPSAATMPRVYVAYPRQVDRATLATRCRALATAGQVPFAWQLAWPWELTSPSTDFRLRVLAVLANCDRVLLSDGGNPLDDTLRVVIVAATTLGKPVEFVS